MEVLGTIAAAYRLSWLVVERGESLDSLRPLLDGAPRPAGVCPPAAELRADDGVVAVAVYPIELPACRRAASVPEPPKAAPSYHR
jgi:hypothetical protein